MTQITVTVSGPPGSGKSTISQILKDSLALAGVKSRIEDEDAPPISAGMLATRLGAIRSRVNIRIRQQQTIETISS